MKLIVSPLFELSIIFCTSAAVAVEFTFQTVLFAAGAAGSLITPLISMLDISKASTSAGADTALVSTSSAAETAESEIAAIRTINKDTNILLLIFIFISLHKVIN